MNPFFEQSILRATGAESFREVEVIQELWSGYGKILRLQLHGAERDRVVVKHVRLEGQNTHPRGGNNDLGHKRKLRSYEVEIAWYKTYNRECGDGCVVPECLGLERQDQEILIVLSDLNEQGLSRRLNQASWNEVKLCLNWLAAFHARFMGRKPEGLWKTGTYWHLKTRPDELRAVTDKALRDAATAIDAVLEQTPFQTLVHGDAKLANFCFSQDLRRVAAVDFQYVGGGCGMKDVAYLVGSCLDEAQSESRESEILDYYFAALKTALKGQDVDGEAVQAAWRPLYATAWTDFHRFLKGWSPGHWKLNNYSERLAREVVLALNPDSDRG